MEMCGQCRVKKGVNSIYILEDSASNMTLKTKLCEGCYGPFKRFMDIKMTRPPIIETDPDTVYMVGGVQRCGTSMMMKALMMGGMPIGEDLTRMDWVQHNESDGYTINEGGLYELSRQEYNDENFPDAWRGKCIKALQYGSAKGKPQKKIKVVYMRRDPVESAQSYDSLGPGTKGQLTPEKIEKIVETTLLWLRNRVDTEILEVWYRDVVDTPHLEMPRVKEFIGLDLDLEAMIKVVNPKLCRYKKESLKVDSNQTQENQEMSEDDFIRAFGEF